MVEDFGVAHRVVLPVQAGPTGTGGPTRREAAGPEWRASSRGFYVPVYLEASPAQRIAEVGRLLTPSAIPTGWASLYWQGAWWFTGVSADGTALPVPVAVPHPVVRPQPGFTLCQERWSPLDVVVDDGLPVASAVRAACFAMRYARSVEEAVAVLDLAAFHDLVSIQEARGWIDTHPSYTGIQRARDAVALADENAWSPQEPRLRLLLTRCGYGPLLSNRPVFDLRSRLLGTPDLVDPTTGVTFEYDGALHLLGARRAVDIRREHAFRTHGLLPVVMTAEDWRQPAGFLVRVRDTYAEAADRAVEDRRWTVELPAGWMPTTTVDQRRALSNHDRDRLLRHRRTPPPAVAPTARTG